MNLLDPAPMRRSRGRSRSPRATTAPQRANCCLALWTSAPARGKAQAAVVRPGRWRFTRYCGEWWAAGVGPRMNPAQGQSGNEVPATGWGHEALLAAQDKSACAD